jgi:hypothetical protein
MARINMGRHKHWMFLPTHSPENTRKKARDRKRRVQITELGWLAFEHKTKDFFLFLAKHDEIKILTSGRTIEQEY